MNWARPPTQIPEATQRAGGLVAVPQLLRELGADPDRVLAAAGLEPRALDHSEDRIPVGAIDRLLGTCVQQTGCEHFGLLVGQRWTLSHVGRLGELMQCAATVGQGLREFSVLQHLNSDMGAAFVIENGESASLGFAIYRGDLQWPEQVYDAAIGVACNIMRGLCRLHWTAREVVLSRPAPRDPRPYRQCFGPQVRFDHVYSAVRFSGRWLAQPAPHADAARHAALSHEVEKLDYRELIPKLQRSLRLLLIERRVSGDALAQILSMHRRTLNRRLQAVGTTFQKQLDEVRMVVARELLLHTHTPIEEIAEALCYADVSAFMHAFRRWTGTTPARFRQQPGRA
jgi:AraC-like DNA-binding protein